MWNSIYPKSKFNSLFRTLVLTCLEKWCKCFAKLLKFRNQKSPRRVIFCIILLFVWSLLYFTDGSIEMEPIMRCGQSWEWEATPYFIKHPRIRKHDNPITSVILNIFNSRLAQGNSSKENVYYIH